MSVKKYYSYNSVSAWRMPGRIAYFLSPEKQNTPGEVSHELALALRDKGHSVVMIAQVSVFGASWEIIDGIRYVNLGTGSSNTAQNIEGILRVFKPSHIVAESPWENALPALTAANTLDLPFTYHVIEGANKNTTKDLQKEYEIIQQAVSTVVVSEETARFFIESGAPQKKIKLAPSASKNTAQNIATVISKELHDAPDKVFFKTMPPLMDSFFNGHLRVAAVMDEFTYHSYAPECDVLQLTPDKSIEELATFRPQLLFIESAWRGKDDLWGSKVGHRAEELIKTVDWCKANKVPTVFWNKEDPVHFETFLSTAQLFDYVFTTDIDCISRYKAALGHSRVYLLPFACQPRTNNPIETYERKDAFCFAGAYYVRYPERTRDLGNFVQTLPEYRPLEVYDRNFGKEDQNYRFPDEYKPYIVGNLPFSEIDKAYKGYDYAINLNSIKQSQSMFARRVFELLASNTITVSNYSRGVRLLFGELVITTDSGHEILRRLRKLGANEKSLRKLRLAGLRKVMQQHTYQDRLAYIVSKITRRSLPDLLPHIAVTAYINQQSQLDSLLASFRRQTYANSSLVIVVPRGYVHHTSVSEEEIRFFTANEAATLRLADLPNKPTYIAGMVANDYYGSNYLLDLALATRYCSAKAIGKASIYTARKEHIIELIHAGKQYQYVDTLPARSAIVELEVVGDYLLRNWATSLHRQSIDIGNLLSLDEFNYCKNGAKLDMEHIEAVDDLVGLDCGLSAATLLDRSESIQPEPSILDSTPFWPGKVLASRFTPPSGRPYQFEIDHDSWFVSSMLPDGKHDYIYATHDLRPADLGYTSQMRFHLDVTPGLNIQLAVLFLDEKKQRISNVVKTANRNHEAAIPADTKWIRLGLRMYGSGTASIKGLVLGHRTLHPAEVIGRAEHLLLTNHYPSYDDLYRNGFVHTRVAAYAERGVKVDVFRLRQDEALSYHEFHDVDVITGAQEALNTLLKNGHYRSVLVHFLDEAMWNVLQHYIHQTKVVVWVHGAEIQPWHRRDYNFTCEQEREVAKAQSEIRMTFWRKLLTQAPRNMHLVFVSDYFAEEVMEDLGFRLPKHLYSIIHNPIDTGLFFYHPKLAEQRKKILSIRPYASRKYANDLSVDAILKLSEQPFFKEIEFRMIGDGKLFDETLAPLKKFPNVKIERRFLTQTDISELHKEYGIFLCPTRMDAQGVSRDEAMASGLVPVTNGVTAIPEFVSNESGILAREDNSDDMAQGIIQLIKDENLFLRMSKAASERVRKQTSVELIIPKEIDIIRRPQKMLDDKGPGEYRTASDNP